MSEILLITIPVGIFSGVICAFGIKRAWLGALISIVPGCVILLVYYLINGHL